MLPTPNNRFKKIELNKSYLAFSLFLLAFTIAIKVLIFINQPIADNDLVVKCSDDCYEEGYDLGEVSVQYGLLGNVLSQTCTCRNRLSEVLWISEE